MTPLWTRKTPGWPTMTPGWPKMTPGWPQGDSWLPQGDSWLPQGDARWPQGDPEWPLSDPGLPQSDPEWPKGDPWKTQDDRLRQGVGKKSKLLIFFSKGQGCSLLKEKCQTHLLCVSVSISFIKMALVWNKKVILKPQIFGQSISKMLDIWFCDTFPDLSVMIKCVHCTWCDGWFISMQGGAWLESWLLCFTMT